jgi:hypothetical protein
MAAVFIDPIHLVEARDSKRLVTTRMLDHVFQKPAHRIELRAEARPISGF